MTDDFDDIQILRRKVLALEQKNGDLGEAIGVLKHERAQLYIALSGMLVRENPNAIITADQSDTAVRLARETIKAIRIDK